MSNITQKRKAAIWLLSQLVKPLKMREIGWIDEKGNHTEINRRIYDWYKLNELIQKTSFDKDLILDAIDLLVSRKHIEILENKNNMYASEIAALREGQIALNEDVYQEEISNYHSDKFYRNLRWVIPLCALIISITSIIVSTCKKSNIIIQLPTQKEQLKLPLSQSNLSKSEQK